jgi:hypothetical protein
MTVYKEGDEADLHRVRIGPVAWPALQSAFADLGWAWAEDTGARKRPPGLPAMYHLGWLEVAKLPGLRLQRLAAYLAHRTGQPICVRSEDAHAEVGPASVDLSVEADWLIIRPDGSRDRPPTSTLAGLNHDAENGVPAESMRAFAEAGWDEIAAPEGLPAPVSGDAAWATHLGALKPTEDDPPVDTGPRWTLTGGGRSYVVEPAERAVAEEILDVSGKLDADAKRPDLSRWELRAARRAGLDAPPAPTDPAWPAYHQTWAQLSADDRSAVGRRGAVPAWKLRSTGTWGLRAEEAATIATTPGVPAALAAFLTAVGACELVVH